MPVPKRAPGQAAAQVVRPKWVDSEPSTAGCFQPNHHLAWATATNFITISKTGERAVVPDALENGHESVRF